jgi:hypothetical protein
MCLIFGGEHASAAQSRQGNAGKPKPRVVRLQSVPAPKVKLAPAAAATTAVAPTAATSTLAGPAGKAPVAAAEPEGPPMTMEAFLDRLMMAESGGRLEARNPRSTALGPFQFIESTFLSLARRSFAAETAGMTTPQILALRTDMAFARKAAEAYTRENAALLQSLGVASSYPNLRLAYLLGPNGAAKVLKAPPDQPLSAVLSPAALVANPFMSWLTARGLAQRAAREVSQPVTTSQGVDVPPGSALPRRNLPPGLAVRCNLRLPSCKHWLSLQSVKAARQQVKVASASAARQPVPAEQAGKPPPMVVALNRRGGRPSPTMEAAARGVPLSVSPTRLGAASKRAPAGRRNR